MQRVGLKVGVVVAALGLATAGWFAGSAGGQQKSQAAKPPFTSGAEIKAHFERLYLQALIDYVRRTPPPRDVQDAYGEIFTTAIRNDWYAESRPQAEAYLKTYADGPMSAMAQVVVMIDQMDKGQAAQVKEVFQVMIKALGPRGIEMAFLIADRAVALGEVPLARELLEVLAKEFADQPGLGEAIKDKLTTLDQIGKEAPRIGADDLAGKRINLADYRGKVTLIDFWATWCGPCVKELPGLQKTYEKYHAKGFEVIGISMDNERPALDQFLKDNRLPWQQVFNSAAAEGDIAARYGVTAIPATFLIGKDGKIARVHLRGENLNRAVEALLAERG